MLNLYFKEKDIPKELPYMKFNDAWFDTHIKQIVFDQKL